MPDVEREAFLDRVFVTIEKRRTETEQTIHTESDIMRSILAADLGSVVKIDPETGLEMPTIYNNILVRRSD